MPVSSNSDAATFSNLNPATSDAEAMGGRDDMVVWGTNISLTDTAHAFSDFLRNFQKKYRMIKDGELPEGTQIPSDHPGSAREYQEMMKAMLEFGVTTLNLDMRNLKAYPPTQKLWYQMQKFPEEIIPIVDTVIKDVMLDLAERRGLEERQEVMRQFNAQEAARTSRARDSSSLPPAPSSDADSHAPAGGVQEALARLPNRMDEVSDKTYRVRPFGLDKTINLRELNPQGKWAIHAPLKSNGIRFGQPCEHQGACHQNYSDHSGHERRHVFLNTLALANVVSVLQMCHLQPHYPGRYRSRKDHRADQMSPARV
jgi:DNA replication licensing factor MCM4